MSSQWLVIGSGPVWSCFRSTQLLVLLFSSSVFDLQIFRNIRIMSNRMPSRVPIAIPKTGDIFLILRPSAVEQRKIISTSLYLAMLHAEFQLNSRHFLSVPSGHLPVRFSGFLKLNSSSTTTGLRPLELTAVTRILKSTSGCRFDSRKTGLSFSVTLYIGDVDEEV